MVAGWLGGVNFYGMKHIGTCELGGVDWGSRFGGGGSRLVDVR